MEVRRASVNKPALLILREISDHRCVYPFKRRYAAPRVVRGHDAFTPCVVEGGLQDSQYAVRCSSAFADRVTPAAALLCVLWQPATLASRLTRLVSDSVVPIAQTLRRQPRDRDHTKGRPNVKVCRR